MQNNWLHLDEDRILLEQLKLLMGNVGSSVIPAFMLATLMYAVLADDSNKIYLLIWCVVVLLSKLNSYRMARYYLAADITAKQLPRLIQSLLLANTFDGVLWGSLTWLTLDTAGLTGSILVISVVGGVAGAAMSLLAPVLPAFMGFVIAELTVVVLKLWLLDNTAYHSLGIAGIIYLFTLLIQGRNSALATRASIKLRFENIELLAQLRVEKSLAESAQREAEYANTAKSKFLAAASHDLRQPIHAQGLFLAVLARTALTPQQQELLSNARAASEDSGEMLNTLLDFSRIEAGVIEPHLQPIRLQPLLHKIEHELAPQADEKNIIYRSRETQIAVQSDPILVELILRNLVSNAIRYTARGGVLVACRKRGHFAVLEIWDTGVGIAAENQQEIFREFHQLGNPERDRNKGLGLGLAIADGLARTLGHELSLVSTLNRGSVFRLHLPIATSTAQEKIPASTSVAHLQNKRILVIDDDEIVRVGMLHLLRDWGCECAAAENIQDALALLKTFTPDLLICDYRLREHRTGVQAIITLRALLGNDLPALLITGDTASERLREAQNSGVPLLHKPVSPSQLQQVLVELLESHQCIAK